MRIGIITFHHALNCGAVLQAWALQTYLQKQGYSAEIVNYGKIGWPGKYYLKLDSLRHIAGTLYNNAHRFFISFAIEDYRRNLYCRFMRDAMHLGPSVSKRQLDSLGYTHFICGSDQVWHPAINEGDDTYFLANAPEGVKRISYAPSFGVDEFDSELERKMAVWLARFDAISVREPQGAEIVKRLCGRDATVVCDPTLLLERADYEAIEREPRYGLPEKYIAVYTICGHPWAEKAALELGEKMKLPVVHLPGGQLARWYLPGKAKRVTALGPAEWLWFVHHAEYVMTNSFHGTVFSLMYHKPFTVALNGKASDARMLSLLDGAGLGELIGRVEHVDRVDGVDVDWGKVDEQVERLRRNGIRFIADALKQKNLDMEGGRNEGA